MEEQYEREQGSSRTEVRADGSVAEFSDPVEGFEQTRGAQQAEHGTKVVKDAKVADDEQEAANE